MKEYTLAIKLFTPYLPGCLALKGMRKFLCILNCRTGKNSYSPCMWTSFQFICTAFMADSNSYETSKPFKTDSLNQNWSQVHVGSVSYYKYYFENGNISNYLVMLLCFNHISVAENWLCASEKPCRWGNCGDILRLPSCPDLPSCPQCPCLSSLCPIPLVHPNQQRPQN